MLRTHPIPRYGPSRPSGGRRTARRAAGRPPGGWCRLGHPVQFVVVVLDAELAAQATHLGGVLALLDYPGLEEARDVDVAEAVGDTRDKLAAERGETGGVPRFQQVRFRRPLHERVAPVEHDRVEHRGYATGVLTRRILWALLALAPVTIGVNYLPHADKTLRFVLACAALIPREWVIGGAPGETLGAAAWPHAGGVVADDRVAAPEVVVRECV